MVYLLDHFVFVSSFCWLKLLFFLVPASTGHVHWLKVKLDAIFASCPYLFFFFIQLEMRWNETIHLDV